ncbi:hypothetical protein TNCV_1686691, partial [Trichonephila clavipes]
MIRIPPDHWATTTPSVLRELSEKESDG